MTIVDYRELLDRLEFGGATGRDVAFSPTEAWLLREHIRLLAGGPWVTPLVSPQDDAL